MYHAAPAVSRRRSTGGSRMVYSTQPRCSARFTPLPARLYTASVLESNVIHRIVGVLLLFAAGAAPFATQSAPRQGHPSTQNPGQQSGQNPTPQSPEKSEAQKVPEAKPQPKPAPELPSQIELLETHIRFESNGDSRKEVHARVKINDEIGIRQFARLNFSYNRAFQSVEIPLAHITHANGGTSDVLPSAITDNPDPAVVKFPAYQDIRVKSIRILGLAPNDMFEYRVVTTTTHHPLAPDFWFEHTFDRSGVTSREIFDLDLPNQQAHIRLDPDIPNAAARSTEKEAARQTYHWDVRSADLKPKKEGDTSPDVALTTFDSWSQLSSRLAKVRAPGFVTTIFTEADSRLGGHSGHNSLGFLYTAVSQKIATVDVPFAQSLSVTRGPEQILNSGYGTSEEKARLLFVLATQTTAKTGFVMYARETQLEKSLPRPTLLSGTLLKAAESGREYFLDPGLEVAPFGLLSSDLRGHKALEIQDSPGDDSLITLPRDLPFPSRQAVTVDANLPSDGSLHAKVKYEMRGDNELVLRLAFHQAPKEKWSEVAQLLAVSDGFRGKISKVTASDPFAISEPFAVQFEVEQAKLVDWAKRPLRVPAIIPLLGLPESAAAESPSAHASIELGTPLDVEVSATVHLPQGTGAEVPAGTSIQRDFATYESHYAVSNATLSASRHIDFILKEIPSERAGEYNAFLHAVQNDESQLFTLVPAESLRTKPATGDQKQPASAVARETAPKP
jgi:hypothetical protein